jgi:hypothetical protein
MACLGKRAGFDVVFKRILEQIAFSPKNISCNFKLGAHNNNPHKFNDCHEVTPGTYSPPVLLPTRNVMNTIYWSCLILRDDTIFFTQLIFLNAVKLPRLHTVPSL